MLVKLKNDQFELKTINIYNGLVNYKNNQYNIKDVYLYHDHENIFINLNKLYNNLYKINKKYKIKEYLIIIDNDYDNMTVEVEHTEDFIHEVRILIGYSFIKNFNEDELLVYFAHEIGHVLDFNFTLRKLKYISFFKALGLMFTVFLIPYMYIINYGFNNLFNYKLFGILSIWIFFYMYFLKYIKSFLSRKQEYNADSNAVHILGDVDIVIKAFYSLQYVIQSYEDKSSIFSTHPSLNQRMNYLKRRYFYHYILKYIFPK